MGVVRLGAVWPDTKESKIEGMTSNPAFHGYYENKSGEEVNYIDAYIFITKVAANMYKNGINKSPVDKDEIWLLTSKEIAKDKKETEAEYQKKIGLLKKNYIVYSFGIINFNTYMGVKEDTELGKLTMQVDAKEMKDMMDSWIAKEAGK